MSSPYIMYSGIVRRLKISIPNFSEITSKSIEVEVSGLELVFYPTQELPRNVQRTNEADEVVAGIFRENAKFYETDEKHREAIEFREDDSLDFFKEIIKQILTNIKVNIKDVCVKVFMNTPSKSQQNPKPQFYSMLRIPSIVIERIKEKEGEATECEEIEKYQLKIVQVTTHLLR